MSSDTREALVTASEQLFAAHGIDAVTLKQINQASGARNSVAVQYHFGDRAGILQAILDKHQPTVEAGRHAMLDQCAADGATDHRTYVAALVRPMAAKLLDRDGGPEFLAIYSELFARPEPPIDPYEPRDPRDSVTRWRSMVEPLLDPAARRMHTSVTATRFAASEVGRRASFGVPRISQPFFVSRLIDLVTAILTAPASEETVRSDDRKRKARTR